MYALSGRLRRQLMLGGYLYLGSYILGALSHSSACMRTRARQLLQFLQQSSVRCLAQASPATVLATSGAPVRAYCEALSCWSFRILPVMLRGWCHCVLHKGLYGLRALLKVCTAGLLEGGLFMSDTQFAGWGSRGIDAGPAESLLHRGPGRADLPPQDPVELGIQRS